MELSVFILYKPTLWMLRNSLLISDNHHRLYLALILILKKTFIILGFRHQQECVWTGLQDSTAEATSSCLLRRCNNDIITVSGSSVVDFFYLFWTHFIRRERFYLFACSSAVSHYYFTVVHLSVLDGLMWTWVPKYFVHNCLQLMTLKDSLKFQNFVFALIFSSQSFGFSCLGNVTFNHHISSLLRLVWNKTTTFSFKGAPRSHPARWKAAAQSGVASRCGRLQPCRRARLVAFLSMLTQPILVTRDSGGEAVVTQTALSHQQQNINNKQAFCWRRLQEHIFIFVTWGQQLRGKRLLINKPDTRIFFFFAALEEGCNIYI